MQQESLIYVITSVNKPSVSTKNCLCISKTLSVGIINMYYWYIQHQNQMDRVLLRSAFPLLYSPPLVSLEAVFVVARTAHLGTALRGITKVVTKETSPPSVKKPLQVNGCIVLKKIAPMSPQFLQASFAVASLTAR